jgi:acyl phosphate:glycerol-3-phosphate acyltransferase
VIDALIVLGAFLLGSIPFGVVVSRLFFRVDIRTQGSGNIGAANALRTLGKIPALVVLLLDVLKGGIATAFAAGYGGQAQPWLGPAAGAAAILGHVYSPWLYWRGGKGVATHLGVLVALAWPAALAFAVVWLAAVLVTNYSSVGSLAGTLLAPFILWACAGPPAAGYGAFAALLILYTHRENIARLRAGTENPLRKVASQ